MSKPQGPRADSTPEIGFCEGPIATPISGSLGLQHAEMTLPELTLFDDCFVPIGSLIAFCFLVFQDKPNDFFPTMPDSVLPGSRFQVQITERDCKTLAEVGRLLISKIQTTVY